MKNEGIILIKGTELQDLINKAVALAFENVCLADRRKAKTAEKLLSRNEASKALKISLSSLNRRVNDGSIKCYKIGARIFFKESELENLLTFLNK